MTENKEEILIPKWELIKDIYKNYPNIRKNFWWLFILLIITTIFIISEPYFYKSFLDNIQSFSKGKITYDIIKSNFILLALIRCLIAIFGIISQWGFDYYTNKIMHTDRNKLATKLGKSFILLPYNEFVNTNAGSQQSIFSKGTDAFWSFGHNVLSRILPQILLFISLFSFGLYINWKMTLVSLVFVPFSIIATIKIGGLVYNKQKEANKSWRISDQRLNDALNNIGIIKIFAKEKQEIKILNSHFTQSMNLQVESNFLWNILSSLLKGIQVFGRISVMIFGVFFVVKGYLTIGELLVFIYISGRITGPIDVLLSSYQELIKELANYYKTKQIIDAPKEINNGTIEFSGLKKKILLNNVNFNYEKSNREVLKNLNLEIIKGQKIALVGHTGSGKTTISNLITRFYDTNDGEVLIDGINIKDYTLESYRCKLAAVFQDTTVFNDTIMNNLKYIKEDATLDEIRDTCKKAEILEFIDSLEKGFDTEVGEKGLKLSGGERQRIAIARAILRNPDILILDEPTSALDSKTESIIQKSLNNLMKGRTSIVIAHRLSTIKNADKIYLLENGEILDSGTHEELCKKSMKYKEMVDYQKNGFIEEIQ